MIFCEQSRLGRYRGLNRHFETVLCYLEENDLNALPLGQTILDGRNVFINRFNYDTSAAPLTEWHDRYIDIHVVLDGEEEVGVVETSTLQVSDPQEEDHTGMVTDFMNMSVLKPGYILITFPEDAHCPKRVHRISDHVKKVVIKVLDE